jgi:uncharacterized protein
MSDSPRVTHNTAAGQFEIRSAAGQAILKYLPDGDMLDLVHTEVPPEMEGQGYGTSLVEAALAYARHEKLKIIPSCPFVQKYVEGHPDVASLVGQRADG